MTVQLPPSGVSAILTQEVPAPDGMVTIAGVGIEVSWEGVPTLFKPKITIAGTEIPVQDGGQAPNGHYWFCVFPSRTAPTSVLLEVAFTEVEAEEGSRATIRLQGAQTMTGAYPLNPDPGGDQTFLGEKVTAGDFEIITWRDWRRLLTTLDRLTP